MSEARFTPGPWTAEVVLSDGGGWRAMEQSIQVWAGKDDNAQLIASYVTGYVEYPDNDTCKANARLIAAAPDLLAALIALRRAELEDWDSDEDIHALRKQAEEAIRKATGASNV